MYREALTASASLSVNTKAEAIHVPVLLSASDILKYSDTQSLLDDHFPSGDLRASFSVGCLLIDALDEVPQDEQARTLEAAHDIAESLNCAMVVSARPVQVVRGLAGESSLRLPVVQLLPFEFKQALQLIGRLVHDAEIVDILKEGIANLRSHMSLSPLSVSLLLDIAEAEREIPGTVGEIFEQYIDIALGRYDFERGIDVVFHYFVKKQMLSELAFHKFFRDDRLRIDKDEFDVFVRVYCEARGLDEAMMSRMHQDIDRSGLLRFGEDIYFSHRSFLDFFVAFYINSHAEAFPDFDEYLADIYLEDKWSEVAFYVFALRRELVAGFLHQVVAKEHHDADYYMRRLSIGRILQAAWLSPSELKREGIESGVEGAMPLFEMIETELQGLAPAIVPYGVIMGLVERSFNSRTLHAEVSLVISELIQRGSVGDLRVCGESLVVYQVAYSA